MKKAKRLFAISMAALMAASFLSSLRQQQLLGNTGTGRRQHRRRRPDIGTDTSENYGYYSGRGLHRSDSGYPFSDT